MHRGFLLLVVLAAAPPARAWQAHLGGAFGEDHGVEVQFDRKRNLVAIGLTELSGDCGRLTVASFTPRGALRWQMRYERDCFRPSALRLEDDGDVLIGVIKQEDEDSTEDAVLHELDGATGAIRWTYTLEQPDRPVNGGLTVEGVEPDGNVRVLSKEVDGWDDALDEPTFAFFAVLLDGTTGSELSRVAVDPPASEVARVEWVGDGRLRRYRSDGTVLWEQPVAGFEHRVALLRFLRTDEKGDVWIGGSLAAADEVHRDFAVVKLDGTNGRERWRDVRPLGTAVAIAFHRGNGFVTGRLAASAALDSPNGFVVARLDGDAGKRHWTTVLQGPSGGGSAITIDPRGWVGVTGGAVPPAVEGEPVPEDATFTVARLSSRTGRNAGVFTYDPPR